MEKAPRTFSAGPARPDALVTSLQAFGALVIGFVVYQGVGGVAMGLGLVLAGTPIAELLADLPGAMAAHPAVVLTGNAAGQVVGLGLGALVAARLVSRSPLVFLRLRTKLSGVDLLASVLGVLALIPLVQVLAGWNSYLPLPPFLEEMEASREALLTALLAKPAGWLVNLLLVAVTPALCEEVLFRGYFQGQMERIVRPAVAVGLSGVVFGAFHLVPTQMLPLSVLGLYMAYVVWRTGSLWAGVAAHLAHNGLMVLLAPHFGGGPEDVMEVPLVLTAGATVAAAALIFWLHRRHQQRPGTPGPEANVYPASIHSLPENSDER